MSSVLDNIRKQEDNVAVNILEQTIGLDPLFRCSMKLKVKDIVNLQAAVIQKNPIAGENRQYPEIFSFNNHVVSRIELIGIVVKVDKRERCHSYAVDDGTGVIECKCWKNASNASVPNIETGRLPLSLQQKYQDLRECHQSREQEGYDLGDLILVRGRISVYREQKEIDVIDHRKVSNPEKEVEALLELPKLYEVYNKPFVPPKTVGKQLSSLDDVDDRFNEFAIQHAISTHIQNGQCLQTVITPEDVLSWQPITSIIQKIESGCPNREEQLGAIGSALATLESRRRDICKLQGAKNAYEIITAEGRLAQETLSLLRDVCQNGRDAEAGCHIDHLMQMIGERQPRYSNICPDVMSTVLSCLEENSDVMCVGEKRYLPMV